MTAPKTVRQVRALAKAAGYTLAVGNRACRHHEQDFLLFFGERPVGVPAEFMIQRLTLEQAEVWVRTITPAQALWLDAIPGPRYCVDDRVKWLQERLDLLALVEAARR